MPEVQLWQALRASALDGVRFRRQHPLGAYVLDFYAPAAKLAVEVDGRAHDLPDRVSRDTARDAWLASEGIRVLRVNAVDVLDGRRRLEVLDTIAAVVAERRG